MKYIRYKSKNGEVKITVVNGQPYYQSDDKWVPFLMLRGSKPICSDHLPHFLNKGVIQAEIGSFKDPNHFIGTNAANFLNDNKVPELNNSNNLKEELFLSVNNPDKVNKWLIKHGAHVAYNLLQKPITAKDITKAGVKNALFVCGFDLTLTWQHTYNIDSARKLSEKEAQDNVKPIASLWKLSEKEIQDNVKPIASFIRAIQASGNIFAIITNNESPELVRKYLKAAGLSWEEIKKIPISGLKDVVNGQSKEYRLNALVAETIRNKNLYSVYYFDADSIRRNLFHSLKNFLSKNFEDVKLHTKNIGTKKYEIKLERNGEKITETTAYSSDVEFLCNPPVWSSKLDDSHDEFGNENLLSSERQGKEVIDLRMMSLVDDSYKQEKIINNKFTVFEYERYLEKQFADSTKHFYKGQSFLVRPTVGSIAQQGIGILLPKNIYNYFQLINNPNFQLRVEKNFENNSTHLLVFAEGQYINELALEIENIKNKKWLIDEQRNKLIFELTEAITLLQERVQDYSIRVAALRIFASSIFKQLYLRPQMNLERSFYPKLIEFFTKLVKQLTESPLIKSDEFDIKQLTALFYEFNMLPNELPMSIEKVIAITLLFSILLGFPFGVFVAAASTAGLSAAVLSSFVLAFTTSTPVAQAAGLGEPLWCHQ